MPGVVVFAYSELGTRCLELLIRRGVDVRALYTHEDDPAERRWFRTPAEIARGAGIPVRTPDLVGGPAGQPEVVTEIAALAPDIIFSFYYRRMIPMAILRAARLGAFNIHGSLLPRYRGRAPVNWAVLAGERETGATLHHMVGRADAGDIVDQAAVAIGPDETAHDVMTRVTEAAVELLARNLDAILAGTAPRRAQDESRATVVRGRRPEDGRIDWSWPARRVHDLVRAVAEPYPGAFTDVGGRRLFVWRTRPVDKAGSAGTVLATAPLTIACGDGRAVEILRWQWADDAIHEDAAHGLEFGDRLG